MADSRSKDNSTQRSYKHVSIKDKELKEPAYQKSRESPLKSRDDFRIDHSTKQDWWKDD